MSSARTSWRLCLQTSGIYRFDAIPSRKANTTGADTPPPGHGLAPESALGSHTCGALSSAPVQISVGHKALLSTGHITC